MTYLLKVTKNQLSTVQEELDYDLPRNYQRNTLCASKLGWADAVAPQIYPEQQSLEIVYQ